MSVIRPKFMWPIVITAANKGLRVNNGATDATVNVAEGTYYTTEALRSALETAIDTHVSGINVDWTIQNSLYPTSDRSGKFVFYRNSGSFSILAGHVASTIYQVIGMFAVTYNSAAFSAFTNAGALSYADGITASYQHQNAWYPERPPRSDSLNIRDRGMSVQTRAVSGATKYLAEVELQERTWVFAYLLPQKTYQTFEGSTLLNESYERFWFDGAPRFRYFANEADDAVWIDYVMSQDTLRQFAPRRQFTNKALYEIELTAWGYVA